MNIGDIVQWNHSRVDSDDPGWAGNGAVRILGYDEKRAFFGGPVGSGNPGPAVHVEIADATRQQLTVWVPPGELAPMNHAAPALALVA